MKTLLKILGIATAILATVGIGAAIFIGWLFDPNDYKDYVADWVESRTGREFVIEDDLELTFFPWLGVETGRLRVGSAEGFGDEAFATAERAIVRVKILPLLLARVELGNLEVDGLRLNLGRDSDRRGNWEDLLTRAGSTEGASAPAPDNGGALDDLNIEGITISNGLIFWREDTTDVRYIVSDLSLETGPARIGQPVRTELSFELVGVEPQFTAQLTATGTALINPADSRYLAENLRLGFYLEDGRHEERAAGSFESTISVSGADGIVTFSASQLEASLRDPPVGPPELQIGATWSSGRLDLNTGTVEVVDLTTNTNGILASWELAGENLLDDPELTGSVQIVDESVGAALALLDLPLEADADADTLGGFDLRAAFSVRAAGRELVLTGIDLKALDMRISGAVSADASGNVSGRIDVPEFDPRAVLDLIPADMIAGTDYSGIETLALAADFQVDGPRQQTSVRNIRAAVMDTSITGELDYFRAERRLEGSVSTSTIDPALVDQVFPSLLPDSLPPERLGTLRLATSFAYDTVTNELAFNSIEAEALGLLGTGELAVSELSGSPRLTGTVRIERFAPRDLLSRFDQPPPATSDPSALANVMIETRLDFTAERGSFEVLRLQVDDSTITGELTVREFSNPEYSFSLEIDRVDVDRYLPPSAAPQSGASADRPIELPTQAMHDLALNGRIVIDDLKLADIQFSDVSTLLAIQSGVGTIDSARARLYGGDFGGGIELDARGGIPQLAFDGTVVGVQLDPLFSALGGESALTGIGNFDLSLSGIGAGLGDVLETTAGRIDFALRDGAIRGFNLGHEMCSVWNTVRRLPQPAPTDVDFSTFQLLRGSAVVTDGIARTSDLQGTTSFIETTGRGQLDLATRNINYDLLATLTDSTGIAGCETLERLIGDPIPLELTGNASAPKASFDFGEALEIYGREAAKEAVEERLREALDDLQNR
ncbi:MAG: AsmA family protein [Gammaproteobacteria bacterium]